ncbi:CBS domain-containing protein [Kitasatospora sp. NPDC001683]
MEPPPRAQTPSGEQLVGEVMCTALCAVTEDESVLVAWELLERSGYRHLPVVRADGRCAGLLDRADLAVACAAPATVLSGTTVRELSQGRRPAQVHPGDTLHRAAVVLGLSGVDALVSTAWPEAVTLGLIRSSSFSWPCSWRSPVTRGGGTATPPRRWLCGRRQRPRRPPGSS